MARVTTASSSLCRPLRVLAVTNLYPSPMHPTSGIFVEQQIKGLRQIGLQIDVFAIDRAARGYSVYLALKRKLIENILKYEPDIVHVMYGGVVADITTSASCGRPVVVSFCGSDLLGASSSGFLRRLTARYGVMASHRAASKASGIVVKSTNLRDILPRHIDRQKVRVIPNGIDLGRFRPLERSQCCRQLGWNPERFHVLFSSGGGDPCKRPDLARAAIRELKNCGIDGELHELSGVSHEQVPIWLNASHVLLVTSLTEGSPNIVKEALACDLPVVSVDVGDVAERLREIRGCYVALPDPRDLASKLSAVHHHGGRSVQGREKVQQLSLTQVAERLNGFYRDILESRSPDCSVVATRETPGALSHAN